MVTLRNLTWSPISYKVKLDESIGLTGIGKIELRQFHPSEKIIGQFDYGSEVEIEVLPYRSCLLMAATEQCDEIGIIGCDYELVRDAPSDKPVIIKLLGSPGSSASVKLSCGDRTFSKAMLDGREINDFLEGKQIQVEFSGKPLSSKFSPQFRFSDENKKPYHRKLADLTPCDVPDDAEALYEAKLLVPCQTVERPVCRWHRV